MDVLFLPRLLACSGAHARPASWLSRLDPTWVVAGIFSLTLIVILCIRPLRRPAVLVPFGTVDPLKGIDAAVHRRTLDGKHPEGWYPEERITVAEAAEAYTLGSAYALGRESELGSIAVDKLADLVVLSRDIFDPAQRDRIADARVEITIVGGKVVYEAE